MPPVTDDAGRPNPLTESVPGDVMTLSDDFSIGLDHPRTDEDLEMLEDVPAFLNDLYELLRAYNKYAEGDTSHTPYDDAREDFLDTWEGTPLITSPE
jgi:hypothetical protein